MEAVSRNQQASSSRDGFEADSTRNEQTTSSEVNKQPKRKSLKTKRREAVVPIECAAAKKSKHEIMQEEEIEESDADLKEFIEKY